MVVLFSVFLTLLHIIFYAGCIDLHSHQQYSRVSFSSHPLQHLFTGFFIIAILASGRPQLIVVLICVSLMIGNAEHPFMCLLSI